MVSNYLLGHIDNRSCEFVSTFKFMSLSDNSILLKQFVCFFCAMSNACFRRRASCNSANFIGICV